MSLIPKEKYEMILKSTEEKDPRMTSTTQKEDVPSEIQIRNRQRQSMSGKRPRQK